VLEVLPREVGSPLGPCLLYQQNPGATVAAVVYVPLRGVFGCETVRVDFGRYEAVDGILVAAERCHAPVAGTRDPDAVVDPFGRVKPSDLRDDSCLLREWVEGVVLIAAEDATALYPLPEDDADGDADAGAKAPSERSLAARDARGGASQP
jgi:hypothetical protein